MNFPPLINSLCPNLLLRNTEFNFLLPNHTLPTDCLIQMRRDNEKTFFEKYGRQKHKYFKNPPFAGPKQRYVAFLSHLASQF